MIEQDTAAVDVATMMILRKELTRVTSSEAALRELAQMKPFWQPLLLTHIVEDRMRREKAAKPTNTEVELTPAEALGWAQSRVGELLGLLNLDRAQSAFATALGSVVVGGPTPTSLHSILEAADAWANAFESLWKWRRETRAAEVPTQWTVVRDVIATLADAAIEQLDIGIARLRIDLQASRDVVESGGRPDSLKLLLRVEANSVSSLLPELMKKAALASI